MLVLETEPEALPRLGRYPATYWATLLVHFQFSIQFISCCQTEWHKLLFIFHMP